MFCCTLLYVHSSIAIILMGKRELIALLNLSSWCLVMVERLFLAVPRGCLQFVIVVFPDHTHLLFFMMSLSDDQQAYIIQGFNNTSRYLDDILSIYDTLFDDILIQMYSSELQLNKANTSDTKAVFLDLHFSVSNDILSTKIYDKYGGFDYEILSFAFLDGDDVTHSTSYGFYICRLIRCARASSHVEDFNSRKNI